ncbi:MAG: LAGLIDADG family homing endonuclease [Candidatus Aenigmatarchaeota archaeon]
MLIDEELSYLLGVFAGDGSLYKSGHSFRVEFSDGTSVTSELKYSLCFMRNIRRIIVRNFKSNPRIRRIDNKFIVRFRNKLFVDWLMSFGFSPGNKSTTVNIPDVLVNDNYEKHFWMGVMDSDGMIGRTTKNITLWSASKKLCTSFSSFLEINDIVHTMHTRDYNNRTYYYIKIRSPFVRRYGEVIGFDHPRKKIWLKNHLKKDFFVQNDIKINDFLIDKTIIDYNKIFRENIFLVDGSRLLQTSRDKNMRFREIFSMLKKSGLSVDRIYHNLVGYRWKMSKGSTKSVSLPLMVSQDLLDIAQFCRSRYGGIKISRNYIKAWNRDPYDIMRKVEKLFDIKPNITARGEILYDSGVLGQLFSRILVRV